MTEYVADPGEVTASDIPAPGSTQEPQPEAPSRFKRILRRIGWTAFAIFCLILFTILKLPEERIRNYVQGNIAAALSSQGVGFSVSEGKISIGFGVSYVMRNVTFTFLAQNESVKVEEIVVSPSLIPLLTGRLGGKLLVKQGGGNLDGTFSAGRDAMSVAVSAEDLNLGKLGAFSALAGTKGSAIVGGNAEFSGDPNTPSSLSGSVDLNLRSIVIDQQNIAGFSIPRLSVSEGRLDAKIDKGKASIKTFRLGKPGSTDDITATVTGNITLGRSWPASTMDLKTEFKLSQNVLSAFPLLTGLLAQAKQPDDSFAYSFSGPFSAPSFTPGKK